MTLNLELPKNQTEKDFLIYNADDEVIVSEIQKRKIKAKTIAISVCKKLEKGAFLNEKMVFKFENETETISC